MGNSKIRILVVDDEDLIRWSLTKELEKEGYEVLSAADGGEGFEVFKKETPDIVLLDNRMPGAHGQQVLKQMKRSDPSAVIIFMTAFGTISTAVEAMKQGAYDYVNKPVDMEELKLLISRALEANKIEREISQMRRELKEKYGFSNLIGKSKAMVEFMQLVKKVAKSEASMVLIEGESGTGKEVVTRAIHYESKRSDKPFVTINCAALPETLLESELFGYEKGAFTDAKQMKKGQMEIANGGTILLDEIGETTPAFQVKLLRLLETRTFKRLGGTKDIEIDVRIIAATNRDLTTAMEEGNFRKDLYYRLRVIYIHIPPLRERREDIPVLTKFFIDKFNRAFGKKITGLDPDAEKCLYEYDWPGNIRELRNVIERAMILENEAVISKQALPIEISRKQQEQPCPSLQEFSFPDKGLSLEEVEEMMIRKALERTNNNQSKAAKLLSISRDAMRYKMKKYGLLS